MISLNGDKALVSKLDSLDKKDLSKVVRQATRKNSKIVQTETKNLAPVESGMLKKAVKVRSMKRQKGYVGSKTTVLFAGKTKSNMFYGAFQEFGYTTVNGRKIAGKHFMKQASSNVGPRALASTMLDIKSGINKAVK